MYCPKCGYLRTNTDDQTIPESQCPSCGIFYEKYLQRQQNNQTISQPINTLHQTANPNGKSCIVKAGEIFGFIGLAIFLIGTYLEKTDEPKPQPKTYAHKTALVKTEPTIPIKKKADNGISCKLQLLCIGQELVIDKGFECQKLIERQAKYSFKWTDGMLQSKFDHYRWKDQWRNSVSIIGDSLQIQNVFGALQNYIYVCDITLEGQIIGVHATPGRL